MFLSIQFLEQVYPFIGAGIVKILRIFWHQRQRAEKSTPRCIAQALIRMAVGSVSSGITDVFFLAQDCFCWDGLCLYPYYPLYTALQQLVTQVSSSVHCTAIARCIQLSTARYPGELTPLTLTPTTRCTLFSNSTSPR
jgi:hypothetical protein